MFREKPRGVDYDRFWASPRQRRVDWPAIICSVMLAISIGMLAAWLYGLFRLMQIS